MTDPPPTNSTTVNSPWIWYTHHRLGSTSFLVVWAKQGLFTTRQSPSIYKSLLCMAITFELILTFILLYLESAWILIAFVFQFQPFRHSGVSKVIREDSTLFNLSFTTVFVGQLWPMSHTLNVYMVSVKFREYEFSFGFSCSNELFAIKCCRIIFFI